MKNTASTLLVLFILAFPIFCCAQKQELSKGQLLFEKNCTRCHGQAGNKGLWGAKNLQVSTLSLMQYLAIVTSGQGRMPAWGKKLSQQEITQVVHYIQTLRK